MKRSLPFPPFLPFSGRKHKQGQTVQTAEVFLPAQTCPKAEMVLYQMPPRKAESVTSQLLIKPLSVSVGRGRWGAWMKVRLNFLSGDRVFLFLN